MAGNAPDRATITVFSGTITTDYSSTTPATDSTYSGRRIKQLRPPYVLNVAGANAGTSPGGTNLAYKVQLQDSADNSTWSNVTGWVNTTVTATGSQTARKTESGQIREYIRAVVIAAAGTWNTGTTITATVTGEGIA